MRVSSSRIGGVLLVGGVLTSSLFGGCGPRGASHGEGGGAGNDGGPADLGSITDLDSFFLAEQRAYCQRLFHCYEPDDDFMVARVILRSQARCEQLLARVNATSVQLRDLRTEEAAGRLHLVPEQAKRCVEALATCSGPKALDDGPCRDILEGSVAPGGGCHRSQDCSGDAYCENGQSCPGTCVARGAEGAPCLDDSGCSAGAGYTDCRRDADGEGTCHTFEAQPKAGLGEPCTRRLRGASQLIYCDDSFWCATVPGGNPNEDAMGVCAQPIAAGDACVDSDDVCSTGLCDTDAQRCVSLIVNTHAGDSCDESSTSTCDPLAGLVCRANLCVGSGDGSEGSGCYTSDLQLGCNPGLYCDKPAESSSDELGTCRALLADGKACDYAQDCQSGSCEQSVCGGRICTR